MGKDPIKPKPPLCRRWRDGKGGLSRKECRDRGCSNTTAIAGDRNHMASGHDIKAAQQTYNGFITMAKWGTAVVVFATIAVILLIA